MCVSFVHGFQGAVYRLNLAPRWILKKWFMATCEIEQPPVHPCTQVYDECVVLSYN